jgi:type IX secretion system PorP/SprF family membrane protein
VKYLLIFLLGPYVNTFSQDPVFTNAHQSLVALNPSFAGSNGLLRYQSNTRNQWYNLSGSYLTFYNSVDMFIKPMNGGLALTYTHDDQSRGTLVIDRIDLTYAQHFALLDKKLKIIPSLQASIFQKKLDNSKLNFGDEIDSRRGFTWNQSYFPLYGVQTKTNIDFGAGLIINYKHLYIGSTFFHITQPDEGMNGPSKLPYRSSSFASYNFVFGENVLLNAMLRLESQKPFGNAYFNLNALLLKHIIVSTGITSNSYMNTYAGFRHNYFTLCAGYEFGIDRTINTAGTYELTASFNLRNKDNRKSVTDFERW